MAPCRRLSIRLFYLGFSNNGDKRFCRFSNTDSTVLNFSTRLKAHESHVAINNFYTIRSSSAPPSQLCGKVFDNLHEFYVNLNIVRKIVEFQLF